MDGTYREMARQEISKRTTTGAADVDRNLNKDTGIK